MNRRFLLTGSAAGLLTYTLPQQAHAAQVVHGTVIGKDGWLFLVWDDPRLINVKAIGPVVQTVDAAVALLRSAGIATIIALIPAKSRIYRDDLPPDIGWSPDGERQYATAMADLRSGGALVPDLLQSFTALRTSQPTEKLWFQSDTHWTAWAAEQAAMVVAQDMKAHLALPPSKTPGQHLGPAVSRVHTRSDLSAELPHDMRAAYPDETYQVHWPAEAAGKDALIADDTADVAIVGSSYMQPKYNFAGMLSSQLNRAVTLHWKVHNYGPYGTMLSYLASESFKRQRPKAVVWSFIEADMSIAPDDKLSWSESAMPRDTFLATMKRALAV